MADQGCKYSLVLQKVLFLKNLIESWFDKRLPILSIVKFSFKLTVSVYSFWYLP